MNCTQNVLVDFAEKNCENYTQDIYEKVSNDLGSNSNFVFSISLL